MKLTYILPEYNESTDSHFYHLYEFLEELSKRLDIFLIIEKSNTRNFGLARSKNMKRVYVQRCRFLPLRFLESFLMILRARMVGYKNFYTHYCYIGGINAGLISRLTGGKSFYWNCAMNWLFKQKFLSKIGIGLSINLANFLVTGSEKMKEGYTEHYGLKLDKIKVMPNWINLNRFRNQELGIRNQGKKKTILFIHWLSERKGAHLLIPIAKQLVQNSQFSISQSTADPPQADNFQFLVIGEGPYKERLLREIKENRLEEFVQVLGRVPNKEIAKYYAMADVFIMPSTEEGFPRVLLEAMAIGIPYVASDVGAVREISPKIAQDFIVKTGDIEGFAQKIKILFSDKEIYEKFRRVELEKVKEYSMEKVTGKFLKLFQ